MKKYLFLVAALFLQILWASHEVCAMQNSSCYDQPEDQRNKRLTSAFKQIFKKVEVEIDNGLVKLKGTQGAVQKAIEKLGDFTKLRKKVIPVLSKINTQAYAKQRFENWGDCVKCLGINLEDLKLFAIHSAIDEGNCIKIPYENINKKLADVYVEGIKDLSPYFQWVSKHNNQLITYLDGHLAINYGILTEHFCDSSEQESVEEGNSAIATLPLESVLKKLMAAAGGEISLTPSQISGHFHVRTVTLGHNLSGERSTPVIDIVIDRSGSMQGEPIQKINQAIPKLLGQFKDTLKGKDSLNVNIYAFNTTCRLLKSYYLQPNSFIPSLKAIEADGMTDLTHVGNLLKVENDASKVVVAFTDGQHTEEKSSPLNENYESLKSLVKTGSFAQPFLCKVASKEEPVDYFEKISEIFAGSYSQQDTIDGFCNKVSQSIPSLLVSKEPLVLTLNGTKVVIWQENAKPDIHVTEKTVCHQDSIMRGGVVLRVNTTTLQPEANESEQAKLEAEIARMQERLKALQMGSK